MPDICIYYAIGDRNRREPFVKALSELGCCVWWNRKISDENGLPIKKLQYPKNAVSVQFVQIPQVFFILIPKIRVPKICECKVGEIGSKQSHGGAYE